MAKRLRPKAPVSRDGPTGDPHNVEWPGCCSVKGSLAGKHPCCGLFDMRIRKKKEQYESVVIMYYIYTYSCHVLTNIVF